MVLRVYAKNLSKEFNFSFYQSTVSRTQHLFKEEFKLNFTDVLKNGFTVHVHLLIASYQKTNCNGCERKQSCLNRNTIPKSERKCHGEPYEKLQLGQPVVKTKSEPITSHTRSKNTIHSYTGVNDVKQTNAILSSMSRQYRQSVSTGNIPSHEYA